MSDSKIEQENAQNDSFSSFQDAEEEKDHVPSTIVEDLKQTEESKQGPQAILNAQTQQVIMEIIQTLRNCNAPETQDQLFKTLTETSLAVEKQESVQTNDSEEQKSMNKKVGMPVEAQLKLLLDKLSANDKLQKGNENSEASLGGSMKNATNTSAHMSASSTSVHTNQKITDAYKLINEVIMIPQIMWTRNFFYSLGGMSPSQQQIVHGWFVEMNEKQKIYIKEIERANDQLKQTSSDLFAEKGFSREQTELFLKKVNFMENREYFFHKRKAMTKDGDQEEEFEDPTPEISTNHPIDKRVNQRKPDRQTQEKFFYDNMGTSCNLEEKKQEDPSQNMKNQKVMMRRERNRNNQNQRKY